MYPSVLLKREGHEEKTKEIFKLLKSDEMFNDVTLESDDGKHIKAHKVILGYSSPYLKSVMLANQKSEDPIVMSVDFVHLNSLIEYIYLGQTKVEVTKVNEFLRIGNNLQIRGLWTAGNIEKSFKGGKTEITPVKQESVTETEISWEGDLKVNQNNETKSESNKYICKDCGFCGKERIELKRHRKARHGRKVEQVQCDKCGFVGTRNAMAQHKLLHDGAQLFCDKCNYTSRKPCHMNEHIKNIHEPLYVYCDQCAYHTKRARTLKKHKEQEHEGKLFKCNECDYIARISDRLEDHKKGIHEGQRYQCDQCEYNCIYRGPMLQHKKVVHEGVRFDCNICDYKATRSSNLQAHVRTVHMNEKRKSRT